MKTFKQMNEDIQYQKQLNEKGLLKRIGQAKDAAVASFKSDPEKHAAKMDAVAKRAAKQDTEHEKAKAAMRDKSKSNAKELAGLKGAAKGYNISKKGNANNPNSMRPKGKDGSFFDTTAPHNPHNTGRLAPHPKGDWVDGAGNTKQEVDRANDHSRDMAPSRIIARENSIDSEKDKDRRAVHGKSDAEYRVEAIKKHITKLKAHAPEAKERLAHAEHTLKLHNDTHKAAAAHMETHAEKEYTSSHVGHYHEHHYGNGAHDHHYEEMERHKKAEQENPSETHINDARLGYDHTHEDHPHHEEERTADHAPNLPKHSATLHKLVKTATAAHHAYNEMVDSQTKAEAGLPEGQKSKTKFHKKAAYDKVDVKTRATYYKKALTKLTPEGNDAVKNLKHKNKDSRQKEMDI
jgi:hypothetical protein